MTQEVRLVLKSLTEQVYEHLLACIRAGEYSPGDPIPSERELQQIYGVSRPTVREAVSQLVASGLLRRQRGLGTFVQSPPLNERIKTITSFAEEVRRRGMTPSNRILSSTVKPAPPHVRERLGLSAAQLTSILERVRLVNGEPVCLAKDYVPAHLAPGLAENPLVEESLYLCLERRYKISLAHGEEEVEAVIPATAECRLLDMKPGTPALFLRRITLGMTSSDPSLVIPVHYAEVSYRADRFRYVAKVEGR